MVRPGRDRLSGYVEVGEICLGGEEKGVHGRQTHKKAIVVIAVEVHSPEGFGRVRMQCVPDASAASLTPFICEVVEPGSTVHTDGWKGYDDLPRQGHKPTWTNTPSGSIGGPPEPAVYSSTASPSRQCKSPPFPKNSSSAELIVPTTTCRRYLSEVDSPHAQIGASHFAGTGCGGTTFPSPGTWRPTARGHGRKCKLDRIAGVCDTSDR